MVEILRRVLQSGDKRGKAEKQREEEDECGVNADQRCCGVVEMSQVKRRRGRERRTTREVREGVFEQQTGRGVAAWRHQDRGDAPRCARRGFNPGLLPQLRPHPCPSAVAALPAPRCCPSSLLSVRHTLSLCVLRPCCIIRVRSCSPTIVDRDDLPFCGWSRSARVWCPQCVQSSCQREQERGGQTGRRGRESWSGCLQWLAA